MPELSWWHKAFVGALGGLALALLKLIEAKFYLATLFSVESQAAYLTYFCYIVLGSVAAVFLAEQDDAPAKVRKSAFLMGLLAPSVLLAIANQPIHGGGQDLAGAPPLPRLGALFIGAAHAQSPASAGKPEASSVAVKVVDPKAVGPDFGDALAAALGRKPLAPNYAYVVGATSDQAKATRTATQINSALSGAKASQVALPKAQVVRISGGDDYYVLLGDFSSREELGALKTEANGLAVDWLAGKPGADHAAQDNREVGKLLLNARVVAAARLLPQ